jgi:hypothetical protein
MAKNDAHEADDVQASEEACDPPGAVRAPPLQMTTTARLDSLATQVDFWPPRIAPHSSDAQQSPKPITGDVPRSEKSHEIPLDGSDDDCPMPALPSHLTIDWIVDGNEE